MDHKDYLFPGGYRNLVELSQKGLKISKHLDIDPNFANAIKVRNRLVDLGMSLVIANKIIAYINHKFPNDEELKPYSAEEKAEVIENFSQAIWYSFNHMKNTFSVEFAMICFERAYLNE